MLKYSDDSYQDFLWAKKVEKDRLYKWLPLKQHLIDTAEVIQLLWNNWFSRNQRKIVVDSVSISNEDEAIKLVTFLGVSHDIAKATPAFQTKRSFFNSEDLDVELLKKMIEGGLSNISDLNLISANKSHHALGGQVLLENLGVNRDVSSVIGAHHGKPVEDTQSIKRQLIAYPENYYQNENDTDNDNKNWRRIQNEMFEWMLIYSGYKSVNEIPKVKMKGQVLLSGLLIMADWIASNDNYFPLYDMDESHITFQNRSTVAWQEWLQTETSELDYFEDINDRYMSRFGFEPNDMQLKFSEIVKTVDNPGLFILEAPMGGGKTEASLIVAEQLASRLGLNGIFFGLPTQATSNGIFPRINDWLQNISEESSENKGIQLIHGKAALNEKYSKLKNESYVDTDESERVLVNEWFSGRKTAILEDYVVGTVDQLLMMSLKKKHLMIRHLGLTRKVVIIDEIHAYDAYMNEYLKRALTWLGHYNIPVIMLSATLPGETREALTDSYLKGVGFKKSQLSYPNDETDTDAYPVITYTNNNEIKQSINFSYSKDKKISIKSLKENEIVSVLKSKLEKGGVAGVIVNTVKRSQDIAKLLSSAFGEDKVELLHSSFIATHRAEKENVLLSTIGKQGQRPKKKIIVGTQVIEQSLDIDFDILVSDLAPIDLLIQRVGRLHRHERLDRPIQLKAPELYILGMDSDYEFEPGSVAVYGEHLLMRSQYYLSDYILIPSQISSLVQKVYSEVELELTDELAARFHNAREVHKNLRKKKIARSKSFMISPPTENLLGWISNMPPNQTDEKAMATVRDSSDSIEVVLLKSSESGYTKLNGDSNLNTTINDYRLQKLLAQETIRLPNVLSQAYNIDSTIEELERYRNTNLMSWQSSPWLNQSLGIILNMDNEFVLNGYRLTYDLNYGLQYNKEVVSNE